jgi:hypothetical protein
VSSELAEQICQTYFNNTEGALLRDVIDAELVEVREVLAEVIREHDDPMSEYGCTTRTTETRSRPLRETGG